MKRIVTRTGFIIEDATWYTPLSGECIGIVTGKTVTGEKKSYIGVGAGLDEEVDALYIAEVGAKFYP